jgi:hypothetical protein
VIGFVIDLATDLAVPAVMDCEEVNRLTNTRSSRSSSLLYPLPQVRDSSCCHKVSP